MTLIRHAEDRAREAAERHAADAELELQTRRDALVDALKRLKQLSLTIERLRREQETALLERDELIAQLREVGQSWNSLAARTGLSRQALSKRKGWPVAGTRPPRV